MSGLLGDLWDGIQGGFLRKPLKKATGLTDAQLMGVTAAAVAAPFALPALGVSGAAAGTAGAAGGATAGAGSLTGGAASFAGTQAAAPIVDASVAASPQALQGMATAPSASGGFSTALGNAGKLSMIGQQTGLLNPQHQPIQGAQLNHQAPQFSGLLTQPQDNDAQRRQQYQQYVQGLLGGSYGRSA